MESKQATALQTRYSFWKKKEAEAMDSGDAGAFETATNAITKLEAEAKEGGVELTVPEGTDPTPASPAANGKVKAAKVPKSVKGAEQVAAKAKALAEKKASGAVAGNGKPKAVRVKKEKEMRPCLDGCGTEVPGNFKMGHDAKLKSLILKVERGEAEQKDIPEIAQDLITFKKGEVAIEKDAKGNTKSKVQQYVVTKAPVRFPGRPDIQLTTR